MQLSPNFSLEEFTVSQTASRLSIDNTPPPAVLERLKTTASRMELVRAFLGKPILVSSGYRSPPLNKAVHGAANSAHVQGWAVDFICPGYGTPLVVCRALARSGQEFDQVIEEGTWVHISFDPQMRGEVLTMRDGVYRKGLTP